MLLVVWFLALLGSSEAVRVGICFFGILRNLRVTLPSIQKNIFGPLESADIHYDVFVHTYNLSRIVNPKTGENSPVDNTEFLKLKPRLYRQEVQDEVDRELFRDLDEYRQRGDAWDDGLISLRNLLRQLNSLRGVTEVVASAGIIYDVLIYARPDVFYFNKLNITHLMAAIKEPKTIYVPPFHSGSGINDRFAFGSPVPMLLYGSRIRIAKEYSALYPLHSETFAQYVLDKSNIEVKKTNIYFGRVRSSGVLWEYPVPGADGRGIRMVRCKYIPATCAKVYNMTPQQQREIEALVTRPYAGEAVTMWELTGVKAVEHVKLWWEDSSGARAVRGRLSLVTS